MAEADPRRPVTGPLRTIELVRDRVVEAVLSRSAIKHPALVAEVRRRFSGADVAGGALVREPVIEGTAPFVTSGRTFADCSGTLLHSDVIRAIGSDKAGDYRFPPDAQPYRHQIEAWEHLTATERRSVLVSSGTGSGKTECFLLPLLHDLAKDAEISGRLSGVRAIALYPLNALIASQEERLRAWTAPFAGKVRFGLYNGMTPEKLREQDKPGAEQAGDRFTLRNDPPPILVTNVTMLEYMMVRRIDRPLVDNSRSLLRWIILDEAHGYVGSGAAEIALLIRRVLLTFGVRPEDVRFVATSATIGEGREVTEDLRRFLRDISGTEESRVRIVVGEREKVDLPPPALECALAAGALADREALRANPAVQAFIRTAEQRPMRLDEAERLLAPAGQSAEALIEAIADDGDRQRTPLLPLRIHGFLRAVPGLWSCLNPDCGESAEGWQFGAVLTERVDICPCCKAPVLEIMTCRECGEPYLDCEEENHQLRARYTPPSLDEFAELREREVSGEDDPDPSAALEGLYDARRSVIAGQPFAGCHKNHVNPLTGAVLSEPDDTSRIFYTRSPDSCGACDAQSGATGDVMRPFRFGAPFLIGNAAPVLLEGVPRREPDGKAAYRPPAEGRQLLSFTDSRQGTARFAANLQTNSERGFVRGYLYHAVQGSMTGQGFLTPEVEKLRGLIEEMEKAAADALAAVIAEKKRELEAMLEAPATGLPWAEMRTKLAAMPEVLHWMTRVWSLRDTRYKNPDDFAQFLLLREFNRRPRRGNTAETMGLVRLRFSQIENIRSIPDPLRSAGKSLADWKGLLYAIVDMTVRGNAAIRASWDDLHWLHTGRPIMTLLPPGEKSEARSELPWPAVSKLSRSNLVLALEKALRLDRDDAQDRALLNELILDAWTVLEPLFTDNTRPGYALDYDKARLAPVSAAFLCPVSGKVLPETVLGFSPYGHRDGLRSADEPPRPLEMPRLPVTFPKGAEIEIVRQWLAADPAVVGLREIGVWTNLHDRAALLSPYTRAAEHSAQQPPARLRRFETEFKAGEINILNCSTTMEMGVDIGSVAAVMMTNVPPALANYRQRVGRAGRRRQGFATSLTYTGDNPLDREAFRAPDIYLSRQTRAPRVKLDSRRIVQRHVNALLLARWFASEGGEALKSRSGEFFGCPEGVGSERPDDAPVNACIAWLRAPSTDAALSPEVAVLCRETALAGDSTVFETAAETLANARDALVGEWEAMQAQAASAPPEARKAMEYQLRRLAQENLMSELAVRNVLPAHGLPTGVVSFVNSDKPAADERDVAADDSSRRRRTFPSRTLDIAIRDYAPGAEVVVDGLVYRSAGVTLNWKRPADQADAHEIQSLKLFWTCPACGAADCAAVAPDQCPACRASIPLEAQRRFLQPAGFTADMAEPPHADTDQVSYVEPEQEQIVARGSAWQPCANPAEGRLRASSEGLVFYSSRGPSRQGYHICLECGRAEAAGNTKPGARALADHLPLRGTRRNAMETCPGNDMAFKITTAIALGCETITDVAEMQPANLPGEGAAWAAVSALREALSRRLGIEPGEMGMAVRRARSLLGQPTHSLYLFDRSAGGAGFAPQAATLYETLVADACGILDCRQPGCIRGCSACVLTADLHQQQELIDRSGALVWARATTRAFGVVSEVDKVHPQARLCRSVADDIMAALDSGAREIALWVDGQADVAGFSDPSYARFLRRVSERGARVQIVVAPEWLDGLDPAARLGLRDAAKGLGLELRKGTRPAHANGASSIAAAGGGSSTHWASRDHGAGLPGAAWGLGEAAPVVCFPGESLPLTISLDPDSLLPPSGTRFIEIGRELDGTLASFGPAFARLIAPAIMGGSGEGTLAAMTYSDRYLQSPLVVRLLADTLAALRDTFGRAGAQPALRIVTNRHRQNERQPYLFDHDWQWEEDRTDALMGLLEQRGLAPELVEKGAPHGRSLVLDFTSGKSVRIVLDQGFGPWRTPSFAKFDFGEQVERQTIKIDSYSAVLEARGSTYLVIIG